jgi:pyruvate formate lyase activating enzyme
MPLYNPEIGLISHIQKYSTKDGPGIRDTVFFKGCPLGCMWCSNPELIRPQPDLLYDRGKCAQCGTCISVCPHEALSFDVNNHIVVDRQACQASGACVGACPEGALELIGREMRVEALVDELLKDRVFYETSGGGVTFSGGEPLYQSGFVRQVAERLKAEGVHTALDTCGEVSWCRFEEVLDVIDLVLFDIKAADRDTHRRLTGRDNDLILANVKMLAMQNVPMHIRLVAVPGLNDSDEELHARMDIVKELDSVRQIDLLPYHRYGVGKYERLGLDYPLQGVDEHTDADVERMRRLLETYGIPVTVGG